MKPRIDFSLSSLGLCLFGLVCLGYTLFARRFAELHLQLPFLDFPIFIGEILLFLCLIILAIKWLNKPPQFNIWHCCLGIYLVFILMKAFYGYFKWGPLAFRHAALFYYPLFAVFSYYFYRRSFFNDRKIAILILILIVAMKLPFFNEYYVLTCCVLALALIKAYSYKSGRHIFFFLLLFFTPYRYFFYTSRTMLVGNAAAALYFLITVPFIAKIKKSYKTTMILIFILFLSIGILKKTEDRTIKPLLNFTQIIESYHSYNKVISERRNDPFWINVIRKVTKDTTVKLYDPESSKFKETLIDQQSVEVKLESSEAKEETLIDQQSAEEELKSPEGKPKHSKAERRKKTIQRVSLPIERNQAETQKLQSQAKEIQKDSFLIATNVANYSPSDRMVNVFFRIFIWKDMLSQLKEHKPILGFDFGKLFRSPNIEFLHWGTGEWSRDGWIAAHNSYFEIIYRSGILGILFILTIFGVLINMVKKSVKLKSLTGILLCGILINWLAAANFLVILELPYNAIPFWSLLGITFAYLNNMKNSKLDENTCNS